MCHRAAEFHERQAWLESKSRRGLSPAICTEHWTVERCEKLWTDLESLYYNTLYNVKTFEYLFVSQFSFNSYISCPPVSILIKWIKWNILVPCLSLVYSPGPTWISRSNNFRYQTATLLPSSNSSATNPCGWLGSSGTWILVLRLFPQHTSFLCMSHIDNYRDNCRSDIRCTGRCIISLSQTTNAAKLGKLLC